MSLYVDEYLATGEVPGPGHDILTGRYACYDVYRCADDRWVAVGAIEPQFFANLCRALGCEQWIDAPDRRRRAGRRSAPTSRAAFAHQDARRVGRRARARPTRACRAVASVPELVDDAALPRRATCSSTPTHPTHGDVPNRSGWVLAGMDRDQPRPERARRDRHRHRRAAGARPGYTADEIAALREEGVAA